MLSAPLGEIKGGSKVVLSVTVIIILGTNFKYTSMNNLISYLFHRGFVFVQQLDIVPYHTLITKTYDR